MEKVTTEQIAESRYKYRNPFAHLDGDGNYSGVPNRTFQESPRRFPRISPEFIRRRAITPKGGTRRHRYHQREIEKIVRTLHTHLWENRAGIWSGDTSDPRIILDPMRALEVLGFNVESSEHLGQFTTDGGNVEAAGTIDHQERKVRISTNFPPKIRKFTCAHELGHAILHRQTNLHRDRPIDGSEKRAQRHVTEIEADKFASYFLMPEKLVRQLFVAQFRTNCFMATHENLFALKPGKERALKDQIRTQRDLSRLLAQARHFDGKYFDSLAQQFGVSVEAMAIRLEELGCIESAAL